MKYVHISHLVLVFALLTWNIAGCVGEFNAGDSEASSSNFLFENSAKSIVNNYTCYKSVENLSCICLFITNSQLSFENTITLTTGLFDFHKMVMVVLKTEFAKLVPKKVVYRNYKNFNRDEFKRELERKINGNSNLTGEYDFFRRQFGLF